MHIHTKVYSLAFKENRESARVGTLPLSQEVVKGPFQVQVQAHLQCLCCLDSDAAIPSASLPYLVTTSDVPFYGTFFSGPEELHSPG